jgi:hypothetical protein
VTVRTPRHVALVSAGVLALALVTGACTEDPNSVAAQAKAGDGKGYVAGDGTVEQLPVGERADAVTLAGTTVDGKPWSMQQVWQSYSTAGKPVAFVGIDIKEGAATAAGFLKANGVTYPSLSDSQSGGQPMLALQGKASATPSTLVLDRKGRIAARVLGATTAGTLTALVDDVLAEQT